MRVALLTPGFSASEDDWCIPALLDLVRVLAAEDDVTVFTLRYPHHRRPYSVYGARVIPFGGAGVRGLARLPLFLRALGEIRRQSTTRPFDVIHAFWAHEPGFLAALAGRLTRTPVVVSLLGGELLDLPDIDYGGGRSAANRFLVTRALRGADRVVAGSDFQRRLAAPHVDPGSVVLQPLGVDTELFRSGPVSSSGRRLEGDPKLLHVASLVPVKDQATLLRAFAHVTATVDGATLHLAGDGELSHDLERLAAELGVATRVIFLGDVPHHDLPDLYRQADLCVLSSRSENSALVVLEAAACGCPTVGTAVGLLPDLAAASRTVEPGDPEALGRLLVDVLRNRAELAGLAKASLELAKSTYSLEHCARQLQQLYRRLRS